MQLNLPAFILIYILSCVLYASCVKNTDSNNCLSYQLAPVSQINGPITGLVNQDNNFILSFDIYNGCGQFGNIEQNNNADTIIVKVNAKYQGCVCTQMVGTLQSTYTFRTPQPGIYYFKFLQENGNYLMHTLIIQ